MQPIGPAITSGLTGVRAATARLDEAAARIATAGLPMVDVGAGRPLPAPVPGPAAGGPAATGGPGDLVGDLVQVRLSVIETAANVRSIEAAIETYRSVLAIGRDDA